MQLPGAKTLWDSLSPRGELCVGLWLKRFRAMGIEVLPVKESARRSAPAVVSNALAADLVAALRKRVRGEVRFDAGSRALYATDLSIYRQPPIGVVIDNRAAPRRDGNESRDEWQYYISGKARMTVVGTGERARTMDFEATSKKRCRTTSRTSVMKTCVFSSCSGQAGSKTSRSQSG